MLEVLKACGFHRIPQMVKTPIGIFLIFFKMKNFNNFHSDHHCFSSWSFKLENKYDSPQTPHNDLTFRQ